MSTTNISPSTDEALTTNDSALLDKIDRDELDFHEHMRDEHPAVKRDSALWRLQSLAYLRFDGSEASTGDVEYQSSRPAWATSSISSSSPGEFLDRSDETRVYGMTDNVTDEQFEEALADAKAEGAAPQLDDVHELRRDENQVRADAEIREGLR